MCGNLLGFSSFLTRGISRKPVQKLWREKANMQISSYRSRLVLARFEYRAYISKYILTGGTLSKRSLFSPLCTSGMLLWRLLLVTKSLTKVTYGGTAAKLPLAFPWTEVSKATQKANGGSGSA